MTKQIQVRMLPDQTDIPVEGACVIMTDVLRASSTIITALANGAGTVIPRAEIEDSLAIVEELGSAARVGGERNGQIVDGFDMGNSPLEYRKEVVGDRPIVLCTTNGTWALEFCRGADEILIGAIVNLDTVARAAARHDRVVVVCAGTNREVTGEDVMFAGGIVDRLGSMFPNANIDENGRKAYSLWRDVERLQGRDYSLFDYFKFCRGGRRLMQLKYEMDIEYCAQISSLSVAPVLDQATWEIKRPT